MIDFYEVKYHAHKYQNELHNILISFKFISTTNFTFEIRFPLTELLSNFEMMIERKFSELK